MKKLILLFCLLSLGVSAQKQTKTQHDARMAWWRDATFGLFIHWGLYSVPAGEYQGKQLNNTTDATQCQKVAGVKYIVTGLVHKN